MAAFRSGDLFDRLECHVRRREIALLIVIACVAAIIPAGVGRAATYTWRGTAGSPEWFLLSSGNSLSGNWNQSGVTLQPTDSLVFGAPGPGGSLTPEQNSEFWPTITNLTFTPAAPGYTMFTDPLASTDLFVLTISGSLANQSAFRQRFDNYVAFATSGTAVVDTGTAGVFLANLDQEGTGSFRKIGSGELTMEYAVGYRGTLTLEAGAVRIGSSGMYWGNIVQTAGTLTGTGSVAADLYPYTGNEVLGNYMISGGSGLLAGARSVTQTGGTLVFAVPANGFDPSAVAANSTLNGTNSITGTVGSTITFEAALALGGSNSTTLDVAGPGVADRYVVNGLLTFGGTLNLDLGNRTTLFEQGTIFQLFSFTGTTSGDFTTIRTIDASGSYANLTFTQSPYVAGEWTTGIIAGSGNQYLVFSENTGRLVALPEPSAVAMAALGAGLAGWRMWRGSRLRKRAA